MSTNVWFQRLGDVPGVDYRAPVAVDRTRIPGHDARPEVRAWKGIHGERQSSLDWGWREVGEGAEEMFAPAREHVRSGVYDERTTTPQLLRRLSEGFELPGEPLDYHWMLTPALPNLWKRRAEPAALVALETFAMAHVQLAVSFPRESWVLMASEEAGGERYHRLVAFPTLIRLYTAEGFLRAALEVAELERQHFPVGRGRP